MYKASHIIISRQPNIRNRKKKVFFFLSRKINIILKCLLKFLLLLFKLKIFFSERNNKQQHKINDIIFPKIFVYLRSSPYNDNDVKSRRINIKSKLVNDCLSFFFCE